MLQQQFIDIIKQPQQIMPTQLAQLEVLVNEYPFFETAHLLFTKGLHQHNAINYSKQLRKTAIVANSRTVLYELLHKEQVQAPVILKEVVEEKPFITEVTPPKAEQEVVVEQKQSVSPVTVTNDDIKVIYINTVSSAPKEEKIIKEESVKEEIITKTEPVIESANTELDIVKTIENQTEAPVQNFAEDKSRKDLELEISNGIIRSYVETDIIKTPELEKEESKEPGSFTDWLNKIKKEAGTIQVETKKEEEKPEIKPVIEKKSSVFEENRQIIDKIIESDPGRIKLGTNKFFTPASDAKKSLLENEHLVTETLAKIYALQGNISKAIRAYEILSLKFPQKSVYFASLIEKLKTNK